MTITIEQIETEQRRLADMIAAFKQQPAFPITVTFPKLADGEQWLGAVVSADGRHRHHIILLPGESDKAGWQDQMNWAKSIGGDLPDRVEGALLFALQAGGHLKAEFKHEWYWLNEQHVSDSDYAWCQVFDDGDQNYNDTNLKFRARAVRRLVIE